MARHAHVARQPIYDRRLEVVPFSARVLPALLHGQGETGLALRRVLDHERTDVEGDPRVAAAWLQAAAWVAGTDSGSGLTR